MDGNTTVKYLQHYLRQKDLGFLALDSLPPGPQREAQEERLKHNLFLKLVEEVGEVSRAIFHGQLIFVHTQPLGCLSILERK